MAENRSEGNASELDTDLEYEEEEEGGGTSGAQSDSELTSEIRERHQERAEREKLHSEPMATAAATGAAPVQSSREDRSRQASNLHNEREKERRKDLKQAVHRLRNQLQLHQTKKATTISVLKASEREIKDLVRLEEDQSRELAELQTRHKHLTWKMESLRAEQRRGGLSSSAGGSSGSSPASVLPSPHSSIPPPLTSMSPVFYLQPSPSAAHTPSIPASPHTPSVMMQAHHRPISPSTYPFGPTFAGFPHPSLLSPTHMFPSMSAPSAGAAGCFPLHPAARSLLMMPSTSPPQSFAVPSFLPRFPAAPGHFVFPTAPGTPPSHFPSPFLLHSISPPGPMAPPHFPVLLAASQSTATESGTTSSPPPHTSSDDSARQRMSFSTSEQEIAPDSPQVREETETNGQLEEESAASERDAASERRHSVSSSEPIDVETPDQEEVAEPFLGLSCLHRKQRKRPERNSPIMPEVPLPLKKTKRINATRPDTQLCNAVKRNDSASHVMEALQSTVSQDSAVSLKKRGLFFDQMTEASAAAEERLRVWKRRKQQTSPSVLTMASTRLPTLICS